MNENEERLHRQHPAEPQAIDLERFVLAQDPSYADVLGELAAGRKRTHWMWFVFPQVAGLGHSPMAVRYAISSPEEARGYLAHPVLGARLEECAALLLRHEGRSATEVLGPPDDLKLRSSMTLFAAFAGPGSVYERVLSKYFGGVPDPRTLETLARWGHGAPAAGGVRLEPPEEDPWERPEVVARFAARRPDHRLQALFSGEGAYAGVRDAWAPSPVPRVLDLGCAGGRNTVWLAREGADVWALDASASMVAETRRRLALEFQADLGEEPAAAEAARRVRHGVMSDLGAFEGGAFDLVVALGVLQDARSAAEWEAALAETARVLRPGGLCLVANFGPDSRPDGVPLTPVAGERNVRVGFEPGGRRMTLPALEELDGDFARHGMLTALPTEAVKVLTERGHRTTLNALYRRVEV